VQAYQEVATQVTQSQANSDFWVAYADWQQQATQAEVKRNIKSMIGDVLNDVQATAFYQNLLGITSLAKLAVALTILLFSINGIEVTHQYAENVVADVPTNSCNDLPEQTDVTDSVWCVGKGGGQDTLSRGGSPGTRIRGNRGSPAENFFNISYNEPTVIYNHKFSGHAIDQMYNRGIPPSAVLDTVQNGIRYRQPNRATNAFYSPYNNITVITGRDGTIVTVYHGRPPSNNIPSIGLSE
jgi:hypothetical protein